MATPFDTVLDNIRRSGYHNQRRESHSNLLTERLVTDMEASCAVFAADRSNRTISEWRNKKGPDGRKTDLLIGSERTNGAPDLKQVRILVEHKSVITAHRNRNARKQDIEREMLATHKNNPRTIIVATVMVGVCSEVLNVPDRVRLHPKSQGGRFERNILPRLSSGDQTLWKDFKGCVSKNKPDDPQKTIQFFQTLPIRSIADTAEIALDYLLFIPVAIDNVNPPRLERLANFDPILDYGRMIDHLCRAYTIRWHDRP